MKLQMLDEHKICEFPTHQSDPICFSIRTSSLGNEINVKRCHRIVKNMQANLTEYRSGSNITICTAS
jgi:hypothetical protein